MLRSKPLSRGRFGKYCLAFAVAVSFFAALPSRAASGGSISGTVSDPSEAVIPVAALRLVNTVQQSSYHAVSNREDLYSFPDLPAQVKTPFGASDKAYSSQLSGTVVDTSGAVIAAATVLVRSANGTVQRTTQSDRNGSFSISGLSAGNYRLVISNPGFQTREIPVTVGTAGVPAPLKISLAVNAREHHHQRAGPGGRSCRNCRFRHPGNGGRKGNRRSSDSSFGRSFGDGSRSHHHSTRRRR